MYHLFNYKYIVEKRIKQIFCFIFSCFKTNKFSKETLKQFNQLTINSLIKNNFKTKNLTKNLF